METAIFIKENIPAQNGRKLESVENKIRNILIQCMVFNKTVTPPKLVGYKLIIADSVLRTSSAI